VIAKSMAAGELTPDEGEGMTRNRRGDGVGGEFFLHGLEQVAAEDRLILAAMHLASICDFAMGKRPHAKADTAALAAIAAAIDLGPDAPPVELGTE
jgi:hypothetical protein